MADAFDMRSNIKGKPGSQGTLFQVKDKGLLNPQQRWPQGYTPERLNEVREGISRVPVTPPDHFYSQPSSETQREHGVNEYGLREHVTREIAKTTVPGEHLRGITELHMEPDEGTHGTYWPGRRELASDMTSDRSPDDKRKTLVHEIGHHVNMTLAPTPHVHQMVAQLHAHKDAESRGVDKVTETDKAMQYSRVRSGVDEAQADDYAVEHFRTGGRKSTGTATGNYEDNLTSSQRESNYPGYNDLRPHRLEDSPSWRAMQQAQFQPGLFSKAEAEGSRQSALQRRLGAHADANRQAMMAHIEQHGTAAQIRQSRKLKPRGTS